MTAGKALSALRRAPQSPRATWTQMDGRLVRVSGSGNVRPRRARSASYRLYHFNNNS